jgi:hypothetical protein
MAHHWEKPFGERYPAGHPRRCKDMCRYTGAPCRRLAMRGQDYCVSHMRRRRRVSQTGIKYVTGDYMVYRKYLSKTLQQRLDECEEDAANLTSLRDELTLARCTVVEVVKLYDLAMGKDSVSSDTKLLIGQQLRNAMMDVATLAEKAEKIEQGTKDKVSLRVVRSFLEQVLRAVTAACQELIPGGDAEAIASKISEFVNNSVRFPAAEGGQGGPVRPPSDVAADMDAATLGDVPEDDVSTVQQGDDDDEGD